MSAIELLTLICEVLWLMLGLLALFVFEKKEPPRGAW
jgi:hypothetical protein